MSANQAQAKSDGVRRSRRRLRATTLPKGVGDAVVIFDTRYSPRYTRIRVKVYFFLIFFFSRRIPYGRAEEQATVTNGLCVRVICYAQAAGGGRELGAACNFGDHIFLRSGYVREMRVLITTRYMRNDVVAYGVALSRVDTPSFLPDFCFFFRN